MSDTRSIADKGYEAAIKMMAKGKVDTFELWKAEAFRHFRDAALYGELAPGWLEKFNEDFKRLQGTDYSVTLGDRTLYPNLDERVIVLDIHHPNGQATILLDSRAEQVLVPIWRTAVLM